MKHLLLLILCLPVVLSAQMAPDFMVTDVYGQTQRLYGKYLDHDKTVMLQIFFSTCPPCNSQANDVEALYEAWGSGAYDVQFIEVSDQAWETNQTALTYVSSHHITFPTVSAQGGSLDVYHSYVNAGFGGFSGTPTYIVIAPDGAVQWNVHLGDLDTAIAGTGAQKPGTAGINSLEDAPNLWIAPNPSTDFLNVYAHGTQGKQVSVHVYSILGRRLYSFDPEMKANDLLLHEDAGTWLPGTYLVRIESDGKVLKTMRFVKR